jgi:hypothetical protein
MPVRKGLTLCFVCVCRLLIRLGPTWWLISLTSQVRKKGTQGGSKRDSLL